MAEARTLRILRMLEGLSDKAYIDASGHSIGYGHFIKPGEEHLAGARLTKEESEALLLKDVEHHSTSGLAGLKKEISQNQKTALSLLAYNAGPGAAQSVVKLINAGKMNEAAAKFSEYNKSRKTKDGPKLVNPELVARRAYEQRLFNTNDSDSFDETFKGRKTTAVSSTSTTTVSSRGPTRLPTHDAPLQMAANENSRVLAELTMLNQSLGQDSLESAALNRIRIEGGGRAGI